MAKTLCHSLMKVNHVIVENFHIANMSFNAIHENKILEKFSEFTILIKIVSMSWFFIHSYWKTYNTLPWMHYSNPCLKQPLKKKTKIGFQDRWSRNAGQKYCRVAFIPQYFRPSLSYHLSLRSCLFLSDRLRQVLLYIQLNKCSVQCI